MRSFKYFVRDGVMNILIRCDLITDIRQAASAIKALIQTLRDKINKVVLYKLPIDEDIDKVYASLLQGNIPSGIILQNWDNIDDFLKLLEGVATNSLSEEYLCG